MIGTIILTTIVIVTVAIALILTKIAIKKIILTTIVIVTVAIALILTKIAIKKTSIMIRTAPKMRKTTIVVNNSNEGERIETKIERILNNNEPIKDGAPIIYTLREEGVKPEHNIRTDVMEIAVAATDAITRTHIAKRQGRIEERQNIIKMKNEGKNGGAEPIQGTE